MATLAVDCSNFTKSPPPVDTWKAAGCRLAIVQAVNPPAGYPQTQTVAQIDACLAAGLAVDVYVWLWMDLDTADIAAKLALLSGYTNGQIRQVWLDIEDLAAAKYDQATTEAKIGAALALCDAFPTSGRSPSGIYSGHWFWTDPRYCNNTSAFTSRKLWDAHYDHVADAAVGFVPYGGWTSCAIKQHAGSQPDGTDLNVLSDAEAALLPNPDFPQVPPDPIPPDPVDPCAALQIAHDALVTTVADIADRLGDQILAEVGRVYTRKSVLKAIVAQMAKEREGAIGPRP